MTDELAHCRLEIEPPTVQFTLANALGEIEALYREEPAASEDVTEGLKAFLEKRNPEWKGR